MPRTPKSTKTADQTAEMATRGEDVSSSFTRQFTVAKPVRMVNVGLTERTLRELDARAARLNVSRQAVMKTLLAQALRETWAGSKQRAR